jgi:hypothetical protein
MHPFRYLEMRPIFYITKFLCLASFLMLKHSSIAQKKIPNDTLLSKKWFISANLTSFIREERTFYPQTQRFITTHRYISIEPELSLNSYFSIKFPIAVGFNRIKEGYTQSNDHNTFYFYYFNAPDSLSYNQPFFLTYYTTFNPYDHVPHDNYYMRNQDLIAQIGINPKIYFWGQRAVSMYLSQCLNAGIMDSYALDYYHSFNNTSTDPTVKNWQWVKEDIIFHHNPFLFLRYQASVGLELHASKRVFIGLESGFATRIMKTGQENDYVYISVDQKPFELIYTDNFHGNKPNPEENKLKFINRVFIRIAIN